jgi:hypothetical protein
VGLDTFRLMRAFRAEVGLPPYESPRRPARLRTWSKTGPGAKIDVSPQKMAAIARACDYVVHAN